MAVEFDGIDEINNLAVDVGRAGLESVRKTAAVAKRAGHATVAGAQVIVPVRTGNLRSTIGVDFDGDGLGFEAGPTAAYGGHVEFGTVHMAPRAYMGPALDRAMADAVAALSAALGRGLL